MKNHYHLLVHQRGSRDIVSLMKRLGTKYTLYFNYKYNRVGHLFQGSYKARLIGSDRNLLNTANYIHLNPVKDRPGFNLTRHKYSSYRAYVGLDKASWIKKSDIVSLYLCEIYMQNPSTEVEREVGLG